jgi:hypothetical protein
LKGAGLLSGGVIEPRSSGSAGFDNPAAQKILRNGAIRSLISNATTYKKGLKHFYAF